MDPYFKIIMTALGYFILTTAAIILITFLVWVVKLEFSWFFGIDLFKGLRDKQRKTKLKLVNLLIKTKKEIDNANEQSMLNVEPKSVKKHVRLDEEI